MNVHHHPNDVYKAEGDTRESQKKETDEDASQNGFSQIEIMGSKASQPERPDCRGCPGFPLGWYIDGRYICVWLLHTWREWLLVYMRVWLLRALRRWLLGRLSGRGNRQDSLALLATQLLPGLVVGDRILFPAGANHVDSHFSFSFQVRVVNIDTATFGI